MKLTLKQKQLVKEYIQKILKENKKSLNEGITSDSNTKIIKSIKNLKKRGDDSLTYHQFIPPKLKLDIKNKLQSIDWHSLSPKDEDFLDRIESWLSN